jgi:hypothetical protein
VGHEREDEISGLVERFMPLLQRYDHSDDESIASYDDEPSNLIAYGHKEELDLMSLPSVGQRRLPPASMRPANRDNITRNPFSSGLHTLRNVRGDKASASGAFRTRFEFPSVESALTNENRTATVADVPSRIGYAARAEGAVTYSDGRLKDGDDWDPSDVTHLLSSMSPSRRHWTAAEMTARRNRGREQSADVDNYRRGNFERENVSRVGASNSPRRSISREIRDHSSDVRQRQAWRGEDEYPSTYSERRIDVHYDADRRSQGRVNPPPVRDPHRSGEPDYDAQYDDGLGVSNLDTRCDRSQVNKRSSDRGERRVYRDASPSPRHLEAFRETYANERERPIYARNTSGSYRMNSGDSPSPRRNREVVTDGQGTRRHRDGRRPETIANRDYERDFSAKESFYY